MSTSSNHTKAFVQCCHGKHTVASSRTLLSNHVHKLSRARTHTQVLTMQYLTRNLIMFHYPLQSLFAVTLSPLCLNWLYANGTPIITYVHNLFQNKQNCCSTRQVIPTWRHSQGLGLRTYCLCWTQQEIPQAVDKWSHHEIMNSRSVTLCDRNIHFHDYNFFQVFSLNDTATVQHIPHQQFPTSVLAARLLFLHFLNIYCIRDFVVGIATSYGLDGPRLNLSGWQEFFLFSIAASPTMCTGTRSRG